MSALTTRSSERRRVLSLRDGEEEVDDDETPVLGAWVIISGRRISTSADKGLLSAGRGQLASRDRRTSTEAFPVITDERRRTGTALHPERQPISMSAAKRAV